MNGAREGRYELISSDEHHKLALIRGGGILVVTSETWAGSWKFHWAIVLSKSDSLVNSSIGRREALGSGSREAWTQMLLQRRDLREMSKPPSGAVSAAVRVVDPASPLPALVS